MTVAGSESPVTPGLTCLLESIVPSDVEVPSGEVKVLAEAPTKTDSVVSRHILYFIFIMYYYGVIIGTINKLIQIIAELLQLLLVDDPKTIIAHLDFYALPQFFAKEVIEIPFHWLPAIELYLNCIPIVLAKTPELAGFTFRMPAYTVVFP